MVSFNLKKVQSEFLLVLKAHIGEYINKPLLNLGFIFSLAIATSTLLSILVLNDASEQQYQSANSRLKSPVAFHIVPASGQTISISDYAQLRAQGFYQLNATHVFSKILANGEKIAFRAIDILPLVLTMPASYTSKAVNIEQGYADSLGLTSKNSVPVSLTVSNHDAIAVNINNVADWGNVALLDIALAWQLFPDIKGFSHLMVSEMSVSEVSRLKATLPHYLSIQETWSITEREGFADALHLNLSALAILGFIVSLFIAFQAANQAWTKRRELATQLRLLGIELNTIMKVMLCEALALTLLASVLGMAIAFVLVSFILPLLGLTLEQLYQLQVSGQFQWQWQYSLWAFAISSMAVMAALLKQFRLIGSAKIAFSARLPQQYFSFKTTAMAAAILLVLFVFWPDNNWHHLMFKYGLLLLASVAILPNLLKFFLQTLALISRSFRLKFIFQDASQQVGRRYLPIAAFYLALTASIAAALMVNSFQSAFVSYLNQLLNADLFVRYNAEQKQPLSQWLQQKNGVEEYVLFASTVAKYQEDTVEVHRLSSKKQQQSLSLKSGKLATLNSAERSCYINEQLAYKRLITIQQVIEIKQGQQSISCRVQAIYYDYGNQAFAIKIPSKLNIDELSAWQETGFGLFLTLDANVIKQALIDDVGIDSSQMYQPEQIKKLALAVFEQSFALTQAIAFVLLSIACLGLFLSANSLELARKPDLHILSSLGYSQFELFSHMLWQWLLLAFGAILLSWPVATALANALVSLILPASFGWSMPLVFEIGPFVVSSVLGILMLIPALALPLYKLNVRASLS
ncbi:ABC transporter permease [Colwellia sp. MB3u-70]|uniref:FtsX-like permease family protein n=1 Tax=unclassified Colwellia TaxID=196834 RepID=UPI0015F4174C|nr:MULTISPECIES: FtsX-like permease family protein [unclassified Colwellia]MBA6290950.1 ABC transporter permease [Colwellia sp. MB3u-8]MBA6306361.1 ABC transporter permease [Colwellia sp. MB3u-70]